MAPRRRVRRDLMLAKKESDRLRDRNEWILDAAREGIVGVDAEGTITFANRAALRMLGMGREEFVGRGFREIVPHTHAGPERCSDSKCSLNALSSPACDRLPANAVFSSRHGVSFPVEYTCLPAPDENGAGGMVVTFSDITEQMRSHDALRQAGARLQRFVDALPVAVVEIDDAFRVRVWNPTAERMFGWTAAEVLNAPYPLVPADGATEAEPRVEAVGVHGKTVAGFETKRLRRDGTPLSVGIWSTVLRDEMDGCGSTLLVLTDLSDREGLEEQLRHSQRLEAVGRLAGGVAHDFNNLLMVIQASADLLLAQMDAEDPLREDVEEISTASDRAASLTRQLLAFSRRQILQPEAVDLNVLVREMGKMLGRTVGEDIELVTELTDGLGQIRVDPGQLQQVVLNLVVNARDAMARGGRIIIRTYADHLPGEATPREAVPSTACVVLEVEDTGHGMDARTLANIFEPFFTTRDVGKGTGLGLSTVYGIVQQSGGEIRAESRPGEGSTFRVYLPLLVESQRTEVEVSARPTSPTRVLLVEDEDAVRTSARRVLQRGGYQVVEARSGEEALHYAEHYPRQFDLLLTDIIMPGLSGPELAHRLRESDPALPVLFISGYADDRLERYGVPEGATYVLQKPFRAETLLNRISRVLAAYPPAA